MLRSPAWEEKRTSLTLQAQTQTSAEPDPPLSCGRLKRSKPKKPKKSTYSQQHTLLHSFKAGPPVVESAQFAHPEASFPADPEGVLAAQHGALPQSAAVEPLVEPFFTPLVEATA
jgi:hypothetical protein